MIILFQFFVFLQAHAQDNEFAATAFYNEFKKIYNDAQLEFSTCKGVQKKTGYEELQSEFRAKCILPLADSGKIIIPARANPYAVYYFEPNKTRLKIDQLGVNLRDAVVSTFGQQLFARTETYIANNYPFTNTLFFTDPNEDRLQEAIFRQCIYYYNGKYYMSFEIRGKKLNQDHQINIH